jgi:hypothetical protein
MAKCPKCGVPVVSLHCESVSINSGGTAFAGNAYCCPSCGSILGTAVDPLAISNDLAERIAHEMSQWGDRLDQISDQLRKLRQGA